MQSFNEYKSFFQLNKMQLFIRIKESERDREGMLERQRDKEN